MINLHILSIGKLSEPHWQDAEAKYLRQLKPYAKVKITELKEEAFRDQSEKEKVTKIEAGKMQSYIEKTDLVIMMHEYGKQMTTPDFATYLQEHSTRGEELLFIFGGPLGLHADALAKADLQLSLSEMTMPHQLARVVFTEQLYRAATILSGKQYHY